MFMLVIFMYYWFITTMGVVSSLMQKFCNDKLLFN